MYKLLVVFFVVSLANSLYFHFGAEPVCLSFEKSDERMNFVYEVLGPDSHNIRIDISQDNGYHIHSFADVKSSIEFNGDEPYHICFKTTDGTSKEVIMDLWKSAENHMKQLASKSQLFQLHKALSNASERIRKIAQQEQFQEKRQTTHSEIILENEDTVKRYGIIKFVVLVVMGVAQVLIIRNLFNKPTSHSLSSSV